MRLTFLGTGAGVPSRARNVASVAVRLPDSSETWLFDCGEGTQHRIIESVVSFSQISRIFISHLHGDHVFGLPGLLASAGLAGDPSRIDIYGPEGLRGLLEAVFASTQTHLPYPWNVHVLEPGIILDDGGVRIRCALLEHGIPTFGFRIEEQDRAGRFDVEQARALGVPPGPLYGSLKAGRPVRLDDGTVVSPLGLTGPPEPGRIVVYCTDSLYSRAAVELADNCDVLIHEATFASLEADLARISGHCTASDAANVASEAGARWLYLTHISSRYSSSSTPSAADLLKEARAIHARTSLAEDLLSVHVPRRGSPLGEPPPATT